MAPGMAPRMATVAILSALAEEQSGLLRLLTGAQCHRRAGREFWVGQVGAQRVVLALSRIGKVAAATTATTLIEHFGAQQVVFTGVAGGLDAGVKVGDVVIADAFLQHDMDASPLFAKHEVPLYGRSRFPTDVTLTAQLHRAASILANTHAITVHQGLIVSGDRFVATLAECQALQATLPDALAVEMEGAAVAQVCHDYAIPFAAMRSISDRADNAAPTDFSRFVRDVASGYADRVMGAWLRAVST
jgi:adenosylhomocysteine nucleosidase